MEVSGIERTGHDGIRLPVIKDVEDAISLILGEIRLTWRFTYYNLSASTIPGVLFTVVAFYVSDRPLVHFPFVLLQSIVYFTLYIYIFDTLNQLQGIEEDRLNKPHRPLVAGLVTREGVWVRFAIGSLLYTTIAWIFGVVGWAIAWQAMAMFLNFGASKHWFWKNSMIAAGGFVMIGAAWQMVQPITPLLLVYAGLVTAPICLIISLQDLRDVEGDRRVGRRTFPVVFGDTFTRWEIAISQALYPPLVIGVLWATIGLTPAVLATFAVSLVASAIVAVRVLLYRNPRADHITYMCFTYWYCFVLAAGAFIL